VTYRPKHFQLHELVPPDIFAARGTAAWELLDPRALMTLDSLREQFGPCVVNDWQSGGQYKESGLRSSQTATGAVYSQHKFGRAFDCKFKGASPDAVGAYVIAHPDQFPHLTTIEDTAATPTWFHFDVRLNSTPGIRIVKP
jgi:hypothetical protein